MIPFGAIFCDLDQVLANFLLGARQALGMEFNDKKFRGTEKDKWYIVASMPDFWNNLLWMPGAHDLWNYIKDKNTYILSACPPYDEVPLCPSEKIKWCERELLLPADRVLTVERRRDKQKYAVTNGVPNLTIDDYIGTILDWRKAGGSAIHHNTVPETLHELRLLGI